MITLDGTNGITNDGGYTGDGVVFADTTPANTLVTTTGGNVGIGTSSPGARLDVSGAIRTAAGSDPGTFTALYDGNLASYEIAFRTGLNNARTERARIDSGGGFRVNATGNGLNDARIYARANSGGTAMEAGVDAASGTLIRFSNNQDLGGSISIASGGGTSYNTSSDYRLKENAQPLTGSGAFIDALQPKTWDWKVDGSKGVGFLAHEAQAVSPSSVTGEKDAVDEEGKPVMQAMEYGSAEFIANIIAELQSLRARVAALEGTQNV